MTDHKISVGISDKGEVLMAVGGKSYAMPWQKADELARALIIGARSAEEYCKANQIIYDNAILQRSGGLPGVGLSDHPKIKDETVKTALHDRNLRRYLPAHKNANGIGDIQTRGAVGAPALHKHPPKAN